MTILWPPFVGWMFFCSLLFRILSRTRVYTYKSTGELKGFEFKKGGKCSAINIPSLDLKTWKVDNGYLIVEGFSKEDDGKVEVYKTRERIGYLTSDSLQLIVNEGTPRLAFLYLNTKSIKELVTPEVK